MGTHPSPADGERLYKVTGPKGEPLHGGSGAWSLPHGQRPGKWREVKGDVVMCQNALHIVTEDQLSKWVPSGDAFTIWEVEVDPRGQRQNDWDKIAVSRARLVNPVVSVPRDLATEWFAYTRRKGNPSPRIEDVREFLVNADSLRRARKERERLAAKAARLAERESKRLWGYGPERLVFGRDRARGDVWCPAWPKDFDGVMFNRTVARGRKLLGLSSQQDRLIRNAFKGKQDLRPLVALLGVNTGRQVAA